MPLAFILIKADPAYGHDIYNKLRRTEEISEVHPLFGDYDLIAKIVVDDFEEIGKVVVEKIRTLEGVLDTKTLAGTKFF